METVQTAVEWLLTSMHRVDKMDWDILFMRAVEMEKEQIINAWLNGDADSMYDPKQLEEQAELYYNQQYGKGDNL